MSGPALEHKLVVLGSGGVGKSAFVNRFISDRFLDKYDPTIEDSYRKHMEIDELTCILDILDTAGQEDFVSSQDRWINEGVGFILMYSITSKHSLDDVVKFHEKIMRIKDDTKIPIIIVGNKSDLKQDRQVESTEGQEVANRLKCPFYESSAKFKQNVEEVFVRAVRLIRTYEDARKAKSRKKRGWTCLIL